MASGAGTTLVTPQSPPPQWLAPHQSGTCSTGSGTCRACPAAPPGHTGTPLPRFRLRMTNFCTAPTARETERGECLEGAASLPIAKAAWMDTPSLCPAPCQGCHSKAVVPTDGGTSPRLGPFPSCPPVWYLCPRRSALGTWRVPCVQRQEAPGWGEPSSGWWHAPP